MVSTMEPRRQRHDHDYYEELLGAVALGAATLEERQAVLTHMSECPHCRAELAQLRAAVTALPLALEEREPSPILRYRIQAMVQHEVMTGVEFDEPVALAAAQEQERAAVVEPVPTAPPQQIRRRSPATMLWAAAALILLAVSAGMVLWNVLLLQDQQAREDDLDSIPVRVAIASPPADVDADLAYLEDRGVFLLSVRSLPQLAENQVFQVWLIGEGNPVSVATFAEETAEVAVAADRTEYAALAVSVEPGPVGSPAPTTTPILIADISAAAT